MFLLLTIDRPIGGPPCAALTVPAEPGPRRRHNVDAPLAPVKEILGAEPPPERLKIVV
jgi:hypothetical protein